MSTRAPATGEGEPARYPPGRGVGGETSGGSPRSVAKLRADTAAAACGSDLVDIHREIRGECRPRPVASARSAKLRRAPRVGSTTCGASRRIPFRCRFCPRSAGRRRAHRALGQRAAADWRFTRIPPLNRHSLPSSQLAPCGRQTSLLGGVLARRSRLYGMEGAIRRSGRGAELASRPRPGCGRRACGRCRSCTP
jgi:hypothetical protein